MNSILKQTQKDVAKHYEKKINLAGLAELHAIEKKITRHYENGTLSASGFCKLDVKVMKEIARFDEMHNFYT